MHKPLVNQSTSIISKKEIILSIALHLLILAILISNYFWATEEQDTSFTAEIWAEIPQPTQQPPSPIEEPSNPPEEDIPAEPQPETEPPPPDIEQQQLEQAQQEQQRQQAEIEKQRLEQEQLKQAEIEKQRLEQEQLKQAEIEKQRLEQEKLKQQQAEKEKQRLEQEKLKKEQAEKDKKRQALDQKNRQEYLARLQQQAAKVGPNTSADNGLSNAYIAKIKGLLRKNTILPNDLTGNPETRIQVQVAADGTILQAKLIKSSGNTAWDNAAIRAVEKTAKLPLNEGKPPPSSMIIEHRPY